MVFGWWLQFQLFQVNSWLEPSLVLLPCFWFSPRLHSITIHYITKPLPPRPPPRLFCLCFLKFYFSGFLLCFLEFLPFRVPPAPPRLPAASQCSHASPSLAPENGKSWVSKVATLDLCNMWLLSKLTSNSLI